MGNLVCPPFLKPGDTVGITCPAGYVPWERVAYSVEVLQRWGFKVRVGNTVGTGTNYFSGTDAERLADLQAMLDDDSVRAILMGRGGYGTSRIVDQLDFSKFVQAPKWLCGFSDITALHSHVQARFGIASLHSPMCGAFSPETEYNPYIQSIRQALCGAALTYQFARSDFNRLGTVEGIVCGGNLALLSHLTGSVSQLDTTDKILFIEDIGEHLYKIDRMLLTLRRSGQFSKLKALLVGSFSDVEDTERPFGASLEEIVLGAVAGLDIPVAFGFPCGHEAANFALPLGRMAKLEVRESGSVLSFVGEQVMPNVSIF
ncbi:MAG: LD-carboxypeptidase [Bacteroidetes bacterium]|nr:LD-carboxypeptidase [Bacteroidota bacterium]